ncbi:MAG: YvcK family protein, partial [Actinobacteria bacterium]|nr:YvcK family protein [Actinomycetota bacterium]
MTSAADARVVAIGGGHGLAASLRALKRITPHITAIVSVADDGGSSGRLRAGHEQAAPGDIRKCLLALADESTVLARAVAYRFGEGELEGHAFGNLLLSALNSVCQNLPDAVDAAGELLQITGRVLPATMEAVELVATTVDGVEVRGQVEVMDTAGIDRVHLEPAECRPPFSAHDAIAAADLVLLGPGSLYTSVLAAAMSPGLVEAIARSSAPLVYVC